MLTLMACLSKPPLHVDEATTGRAGVWLLAGLLEGAAEVLAGVGHVLVGAARAGQGGHAVLVGAELARWFAGSGTLGPNAAVVMDTAILVARLHARLAATARLPRQAARGPDPLPVTAILGARRHGCAGCVYFVAGTGSQQFFPGLSLPSVFFFRSGDFSGLCLLLVLVPSLLLFFFSLVFVLFFTAESSEDPQRWDF